MPTDGDEALLLESIVEHLPDMLFVKDAEELRFVLFNQAGEALLGWDRAALLGKNDRDLFPSDEADFFVGKDREVLASGALLDIPEERIHTAHGVRFLHTRKIPIVGADGLPRYLLGISRDVTELANARRELRAREAHLTLLVERFPGVVWTCDEALRVLEVSGSCAAELGLTADVVGRAVAEALPPAFEVDLTEVHRAVVAGEARSYEFEAGGRHFEARVEPLPAGESAMAVGVALDVTERRRLEAERLEARLQRTQRMEALGVLAGGIAHDFNNLLVAMLGSASLAQSRLSPRSEAWQDLERVVDAAERAAELTRQMLAYSGKGRFVVEAVDLSSILRQMTHLLRASISKGATLVLDLADELPRVEADVAQLRQVVMNLLTNASDAIGEATGTIRVTTRAVVADSSYLASSFPDAEIQPGTYVSLEVADSGCGMHESVRRRMFDPFFTTKPQGHGLGLAAALGIVRGHRGAIRVYSEPGSGTSIKVLLPAVSSSDVQRVTPAPALARARVQGVVLVVDDEPAVRDLARAALGSVGIEVLEAPDGEAAIVEFRANADRIGCVLLDMTMPRMDGVATFRALRALAPDLRVVLSSGYNEQDAISRFAGKGLAAFLQKPYRASDLIGKIVAQLQPADVDG